MRGEFKAIGDNLNANKKGALCLDLANPDQKEAAMFLSFSPFTEGSEEYNTVFNCLPKLKGIKRGKAKMAFAFDLVRELHKRGYRVVKPKSEK